MQSNENSVRTHTIWMLIIACIVTFFPTVELSAQEATGLSRSLLEGWRNQPHCGLYCLYAYTRMAGKPVHLTNLVRPKYFTPYKGTTLKELLTAAKDFGFYGKVLENLTVDDLRRSPYPVILYVKNDLNAKAYNHYLLFVGEERGRARLIDPPFESKVVPYRDIGPLWGGNALLLSTEPIHEGFLKKARLSKLLVWSAVVIASILMIRFVSHWLARFVITVPGGATGFHLGQAAGIGLLALLCGMGYHIVNDAGFLVHPQAVSALQSAHISTFFPKLPVQKTIKLLKNGSVFVDARMPHDFQLGHLEGAINIPVTTSQKESAQALNGISADSPIVVYCQSSGCRYADEIAIRLRNEGYSNISIFRGGWAEWVAKNGEPKEAAI